MINSDAGARALASVGIAMLGIFVLGCPPLVHAQSGGDDYVLRIADAIGSASPIVTSVHLDNPGGEVEAWSFGVCHDAAVLTVLAVDPAPATLLANGGAPADFQAVQLLSDGFTVAAVVDLVPDAGSFNTLPSGLDHELNIVTYEVVAGFVGQTSVTFCETLAEPPVAIVISSGVASQSPLTIPGTLLSAPVGEDFQRGECNDDGFFDISDPVFLVEFLFIPGSSVPTCDDACDANNDGVADVSDVVYALAYAFIPGSPEPPPPFLVCGPDRVPNLAGCELYSSCP